VTSDFGDRRLSRLTRCELPVAVSLGMGMSDLEIAASLHFAHKTVKNRVSSIIVKGGFVNRTDTAVYVARMLERGRARWEGPASRDWKIREAS
jgi:DNA-binding NarL/FixJ family response regulator